MVNPTDEFTINSRGGDDQIELNGFGSGAGLFGNPMRAPITLDGQAGVDSIFVNTNLALGAGDVTGDFVASAESIFINASIDTTGGTADGNVSLSGGTAVVVDSGSVVSVGNAVIDIDANGGSIDAGNGTLQSDFADVGILLRDATTVTLGDTFAVGTLQVGQSQDVTGLVSQSLGSAVEVDRFTASTTGQIDLSNPNNEIRLVENVLSGGEIAIVDSDQDLDIVALDSAGNDVSITASGSIFLDNGAITATGATVGLSARVGIEDSDPDDAVENISAAVITLTGGSGGIGQNTSDINVLATQAINASTAVFNTDISLATLGGAFPVGLINAGNGDVNLLADSIDDATTDAVADLIANRLQLTATTGIGVNERLELENVRTIVATTLSGGIDLDLAATLPTTIEQLSTESGDIRVSQAGGQRLDVRRVENLSGSVQLTNVGGSINLLGDGMNPVSVSAGGTGGIEINATGNSSSVIVGAGVESDLGDVSLLAGRNVIFNADGDVSSTDGAIIIRGDQAVVGNGAIVGIADGAVIDAGVGTIDIQTDGVVTVGALATGNASVDAILIVSRSASINDSGDQDIDLVANSGTVTLRSQTGIGDANAIESQIANLDASVAILGAIRLVETDSIVLESVIANDGQITVLAGGTITAVDIQSTNANELDDANANADANSRDILLTTTGDTSDILVDQIVALGGADVFLVAADDVLETNDADTVASKRMTCLYPPKMRRQISPTQFLFPLQWRIWKFLSAAAIVATWKYENWIR